MVSIMAVIMVTMEMRSNMKRIVALLVLVLLLTACGSKNVQEETPTVTETEETVEVEETKEIKLYAMFGVDSRPNAYGAGTRSDSIMIIAVDDNTGTIKVASIYRDTLAHIEGRDQFEKITHAHAYGGPELAVSTLNENFDFNIEDYVTFNFNSAAELIDSIGGIEQEIDESEVAVINGYIDEVNKLRGTSSAHITTAGTYNLDGTEAVAYSRIRYTDGADFKRTERQRTILFKVFEKAKDLSTTEKASIVTSMLNMVSTSLDEDDVLKLLNKISNYEISDMEGYPKKGYSGLLDIYSYGARYVEIPYTLEDMVKELHAFLLHEENYEVSEKVKEYSDYEESLVDEINYDISSEYGNGEDSDILGESVTETTNEQ